MHLLDGWEVIGSILGPNCIIAKSMNLLLLCQIRDSISMSRGNALAQNRRNSIPCTVRTSRQRACNQRVGCLLCNMARINDLWDVSLDIGRAQGAWFGPLLFKFYVPLYFNFTLKKIFSYLTKIILSILY